MTPRVLVLDNDAALGQLLGLVLARGGLEPLVVARADAAERRLRAGGIDFLLLDLNLASGRSGERLALEWERAGILPPFLIVTGTPSDERLAGLAGLPSFQGVVAKPFSVVELAERIRAGCASFSPLREAGGGQA